MSGGHFEYNQFKIRQISEDLQQLIINNGSQEVDEYGSLKYQTYSSEVIEKFKIGYNILRLAEQYTHRIDWLVSGDDGDDSFLSRLESDLSKLKNELYNVGDE